MRQMWVRRVETDPMTEIPVVVLQEVGGQRRLPIWIGAAEATAITAHLDGVRFERPLTHDLLSRLATACALRLERAEIYDMREHVCLARLRMRLPDERALVLEARPSDALALALRLSAPIFVNERVIAEGEKGEPPPELLRNGGKKPNTEDAQWLALLAGLSDEDFGKWKM
jgi:bifunctional DNase/RNase